MTHDLLTVDQGRPLHPVEIVIVAAATAQGLHIRICACGLLLAGKTGLEVACKHTEHARHAAILRGWT